MSYFAQTGSVRAISKMFESISVPMIFTNVEPLSGVPEESSVTGTKIDSTANVVSNNDIEVSNVDNDINNNNNHLDEKLDEQLKTQSNTTLENNNNDKAIPSETNVYKHLKTYPIVDSWIKIFHWIPGPRIVRPTLMNIAYSNSLRPYTSYVDNYFDNQLNNLDEALPLVKTLRMRDIRNVILDDPIKNISVTTGKALVDVGNLTQRTIIKPSRDGIHQLRDLRGEYISFVDNQPIIRSHINPLIKQINMRLINDINTFLPLNAESENIPISYVDLDDQSNELAYTFQIINMGLLRSRPVLQERLQDITKSPQVASKHIASIYQESKENRGEGRIIIIIATIETIRKLVSEGYTLMSANAFLNFLGTQPNESEKLSIAEEIIDPVEDKENTENVTLEVDKVSA